MNYFKNKDDATEQRKYRGLKLLEHMWFLKE